jgi:hypothetical protein
MTAFGNFTLVILAFGAPLTGRAQSPAVPAVAEADGPAVALPLGSALGLALTLGPAAPLGDPAGAEAALETPDSDDTSSSRPADWGPLVEHAPSASRAITPATSRRPRPYLRMSFPRSFKY